MRMNLRRIREIQNIKLRKLARECNMDVERLRAIENYSALPTHFELCRILKQTKHYFDEVVPIIWHDIEDHYIPSNYKEYNTIQDSLKLEGLSTDDYESLTISNKERN